MTAKRRASYHWRLREVMALQGLFNASDLMTPLAERGITLSSVQVWRLVTQTPERLSLPVLAALCDILDVTPTDLIVTSAANVAPRKRAAAGGTTTGRQLVAAAAAAGEPTPQPVTTGPSARSGSCRHCQAPTEPPLRTCARCLLDRALRRRLDDGTGTISVHLKPLYDLLLQAQNPVSARGWLNKPNVAPLLTELATSKRDLTHEALQTYPYRVAEHVRGLLIACGVLPEADKVLLDYERWLDRRLAANATHPHIRLLTQFARWDQLSGMRAAAARKPLAVTAFHNARRRFVAAARFLDWLATNNIALTAMTQPDLDTWWLNTNVSQRQVIVAFWNWATTSGHLPKLHFPRVRFNQGTAMTQPERLDLIRSCMSNEETPVHVRVAVILMLLYAQPLTRILRLTIDDITHDGDQLVIHFGEPASYVPEPFATLLLTLIEHRFERATVTRGTSRWLFPGGVPGQPLNRENFYHQVRSLGFPIRAGRVGTLRHLVLDVPAPVVATALGFHQTTTTRQATNAGGTWNRYSSGSHGE